MNLRVLGIAAASAAVLAFTASTAAAAPDQNDIYPPSEYCDITASPTKLQVGGTTKVTLTDAPNTKTTLTVTSTSASNGSIQIAGVQSQSRTTNADGKATFSVTLNAEGNYSLDASMATGEICALSVRVLPESGEEGVLGTEDEVSDAATLAFTGANTVPYLAAAAALAGLGAAGVALSRRRRHS
ncbi:MAG: hypothetical protein AAGC63_01775 [Propionicimonas sp.]|nr:hypothetical protein [Propionicimonas sp.]